MRPIFTQTILPLIIGLAIGFSAGFGTNRFFCHPHDGDRKEHRMKHFVSELDLNPQQEEELKGILEKQRSRIRELRQEMRPRFQEIRQEARVQIRARLTPEQKVKFDALEKKRDERRSPQFHP